MAPPAVLKGEEAEEWLTGVLGGERDFSSVDPDFVLLGPLAPQVPFVKAFFSSSTLPDPLEISSGFVRLEASSIVELMFSSASLRSLLAREKGRTTLLLFLFLSLNFSSSSCVCANVQLVPLGQPPC